MSKKVYFLFPATGPTTSMILRQPVFADSLGLNTQVQVSHSRNGDVYAYKRTPSYQTLKLTFEKMRQTAMQGFSGRAEIIAFLNASAAGKVLYIDHLGRHWTGIITTPNVEFVNQGADDNGELFGFTLEFEGS